MLKSLFIKDYALIEKINIEFGGGLNIITGETGAGKSILIDAMGLLLGERANTEVVRKGSDKAVVEGFFDVESNHKVKSFFEANELDFQNELILRREISLKGSNRCFINDSPVNLNIIKELGNLMVDLHGQHDHQSLLRNETHIEFVDEFGDTHELLRNYRWLYSSLNKLKSDLDQLIQKEQSLKEKKDIYAFQIKEIDSISPVEDEDEQISNDLKILENSEKLLELTSVVYSELYESENSLFDSFNSVKHKLDELASIDKSFSEIRDESNTVSTLLGDIAEFLRKYNSKIDLDPEKLEGMRERLASLTMLRKKYGGSLKAVIELRNKIGKEFELAENYSASIKQLEDKINAVRETCGAAAEKLSRKRIEISKSIEKEVQEVLKELGIKDSVFKVKIEQQSAEQNVNDFIISKNKKFKYDNHGIDSVEFYISTNAGEDPKPLIKVASGGEVSRVMLAMKTILAKNDKLPLLIFDEIDTGISGKIAQKVGQTMKSLASFHQIISITHLPQIAGLADHHYAVEKKIIGERVVSLVTKLNETSRVKEIAKLLSGENITDASLKSARELIGL
ncbi:MAG: DNA repair protein RecN [Ignavibacteriales bacterium]|nr:MAG: DNA repair protein RecN [Ignavibacteriales bacterium]